jgi:hypothetical protein
MISGSDQAREDLAQFMWQTLDRRNRQWQLITDRNGDDSSALRH